MATDSRAVMQAYIDANVDTNGTNDITGAELNSILTSLIAGTFNLNDDASSLVADTYRSAEVAVVSGVAEVVVFSTALASTSYQIFLHDTDGVGWETITSKLTTGFTFTPLGTGNITYMAILNL